jgi:hypothetical protein
MASADFSSTVIAGMCRQGFDEQTIRNIIGVSVARLKEIRAAKKGLTYRQLMAIEQATQRTGGQFAASELEPDGGPLTEITEVLAATVPPMQRRKRRPTSKRVGQTKKKLTTARAR